MERAVDAVVIGAGVVGASVAQTLAREGMSVTVVDGADGIGGGCSYANAALVAPHHVTPLATPELLREAPVQMVRRPPAVRLSADPTLVPWMGKLVASARPARVRVIARRLRELAIESTQLHVDLAEAGVSPTLRKTGAVDVYARSADAGGTHHSEEWTLESRSFVTAMLDDAAAHGADIRFGADVKQLVVENGAVVGVDTDAGTIRAGHVVLAAGLGSSALAAQAGVRLPLRGGRGYVIDLADSGDTLSMPVRIKEHRIVVTPLADRIRVCGSIEFGDEDRPIELSRADALYRVASSVIPELADRPVIDRWGGERPCTSDGAPVIGPTNAVGNLVFATGHGMWGMILAPVSARIVADTIGGDQSQVGYAWLSPDRFASRRKRSRKQLLSA